MTNSELYLLAMPVIGYGALAFVAALAAWSAIRRHPKKARAKAGMHDADIERALNDLSLAIAERKRARP